MGHPVQVLFLNGLALPPPRNNLDLFPGRLLSISATFFPFAAPARSAVDVTTTPLAVKRKRAASVASPAVVKKLLNPASPAVAAAAAAGNSAKRARIMRNK